jgi:hypothetical protein
MATRRRGVKNTRRRRNLKTSIRKKTYRKKNININKKKISNKVTRRLGRLHHVGGAGEEDSPIEHEDIKIAENIIEATGLAPEGKSSQQFVEEIEIKLKKEGLLDKHIRPTKLSLYGKLFEYIFARKDLMLEDKLYNEFVATKGQEKYDVDPKYTMGDSVNAIFKDCYLSLKTKQVLSPGGKFAGYVETGKALTLLDSLKDVVTRGLGRHGFKMVLESYLPIRDDSGKLVAVTGQNRSVYDIKNNIGRILGEKYNSAEEIQSLIDSVSGFNNEGSKILNNPKLTPFDRCSQLKLLKNKINDFSKKMAVHGCKVRLDVKASRECGTFRHDNSTGKKKAKIPQYRIASSLDVSQLIAEDVELDPASPIAFDSQDVNDHSGLGLHAKWYTGVATLQPTRSGREKTETFNQVLKEMGIHKSVAPRSDIHKSVAPRSFKSIKSPQSETKPGAIVRPLSNKPSTSFYRKADEYLTPRRFKTPTTSRGRRLSGMEE